MKRKRNGKESVSFFGNLTKEGIAKSLLKEVLPRKMGKEKKESGYVKMMDRLLVA